MRLLFKTRFFTVVTAGLVIFSSCKQGGDNLNKPQPPKMPPLVEVQASVKTRMVSCIDITGTIVANISSEISSPANGVIEKLYARENQRVVKDKLIAIINPTDRLMLIANNQLQIKNLEQQLSGVDKNSEKYKSLKLEIEKANTNLEYAKTMYQTIPVICPMNGLVTQRFHDEGSQVTSGEKILVITDMSSLVIKAEVNEKYFDAVRQGRKINLMLNAYPNDTLTGSISLLYPQIDANTRTVKFDVKIQNFNKTLLPGMMAQLRIPVVTREQTIAVNDDAVLTGPDNRYFLFVINKDSIAQKRTVVTGITNNAKTEIISGVMENENVVIKGQEMLNDGVKVTIR